jgi:hypothetical protein
MKMPSARPIIQSFAGKLQVGENVYNGSNCILWKGSIQSAGYGIVERARKKIRVHRWAYAYWVDSNLTADLYVDHLCHNADPDCDGKQCVHRRCVNPLHLEAVSNVENVLRGKGIGAANARKTQCPNGHPYDAVYSYGKKLIHRKCSTCASEQYLRKRALREL